LALPGAEGVLNLNLKRMGLICTYLKSHLILNLPNTGSGSGKAGVLDGQNCTGSYNQQPRPQQQQTLFR